VCSEHHGGGNGGGGNTGEESGGGVFISILFDFIAGNTISNLGAGDGFSISIISGGDIAVDIIDEFFISAGNGGGDGNESGKGKAFLKHVQYNTFYQNCHSPDPIYT
jgi:hypothetical protein